MNTRTIQRRVIRRAELANHKLACKNIYLFDKWESDVITLDHMNRLHEIEVKRSRSDFHADFNKEEKHYQMSNGYGAHQFYYACPQLMIKPEEIPEYAGLIYCTSTGAFIAKSAPALHDDVASMEQMLKIAERIYIDRS